MSTDRLTLIREYLIKAFAPEQLDVIDDSHKHIGHAGALSGGGHYTVVIKSKSFENKARLTCHRMIYEVLDPLMEKDIHALSIKIIN